MGLFVSVCGIHVGMNQSEVIKSLAEQGIAFGKNNSCVFTTNNAIFCGEKYSVRFEIVDGVVSRIAMAWILNNKGLPNTIKEETRINDAYNKVSEFISKNDLYKFSENTEFNKGLRFKRSEHINLYNRIRLSAQYKTTESGLNAVFVSIEDVNSEEIEPQVFEFLRSQSCMNDNRSPKRFKSAIFNYSIQSSHVYKIILIIIIAIIGFLYVQNNRYYYAKKRQGES